MRTFSYGENRKAVVIVLNFLIITKSRGEGVFALLNENFVPTQNDVKTILFIGEKDLIALSNKGKSSLFMVPPFIRYNQ